MKRNKNGKQSASATYIETLSTLGTPQQLIPSTIDPIQRIEAEGNAYRNLKEGNSHWWVVWASWLFIALPMALAIFGIFYIIIIDMMQEPVARREPSGLFLAALFSLLPGSMIYIVVKGTLNKYRRTHRAQVSKQQRQQSRRKAANWQGLKASQLAILNSGWVLDAVVISEEKHGTVRFDANVSSNAKGYCLRMRQKKEGEIGESRSEINFGTWEELAQYLETNTFFLISDFRS